MTNADDNNPTAAELQVPYDTTRNGEEPADVEATPDGTEYEDTGIAKPFNPTLINIIPNR